MWGRGVGLPMGLKERSQNGLQQKRYNCGMMCIGNKYFIKKKLPERLLFDLVLDV